MLVLNVRLSDFMLLTFLYLVDSDVIRDNDVDTNALFVGQQGDRLGQAGELVIGELLTNIVEEVADPLGMLVTDHRDLNLCRLELTFHTHVEHSFTVSVDK